MRVSLITTCDAKILLFFHSTKLFTKKILFTFNNYAFMHPNMDL